MLAIQSMPTLLGDSRMPSLLGADPDVASVIAAQKAINAAASKLGLGTGPSGGLFVQRNYELAQAVARQAASPGRLRDLLIKAPGGQQAIGLLEFETRHSFSDMETVIEDATLNPGFVGAYLLVATVAPQSMSTKAKILVGVGVAAVVAGVATMALSKSMTGRHLSGGRRRRRRR